MGSSEYQSEEDVAHHCPECNSTEDVAMFLADGMWYYFEDDALDCSCNGTLECVD